MVWSNLYELTACGHKRREIKLVLSCLIFVGFNLIDSYYSDSIDDYRLETAVDWILNELLNDVDASLLKVGSRA